MHIVCLNQYYPPDAAPTGVMLEGLVKGLIGEGHEVTVICASVVYADGGGVVSGADIPSKLSSSQSSTRDKGEATTLPSTRVIRIGTTAFGRGNFLGKLLDYVAYYFGVAWKLLTLHPRPDRIIALTTPPYLSVLARAASKLRGADHAHWIMDLYPDVMVAHGMIGRQSSLCRILTMFTRWGLGGKRCAAILTLGPDMAARLERYVKAGSGSVQWVPLWGNETEAYGNPGEEQTIGGGRSPWSTVGECGDDAQRGAQALRRQRNWPDEALIVMYSGNMGLGHRFGEILEAARILAEGLDREQEGPPLMDGDGDPKQAVDARVIFALFGGGKRRQEVKEFLKEHPCSNVEMHDYAPADILADHLRSADVHLASLDAQWTGTMVPSKLQGIFASGRPVIFIGSTDSSIGRWVEESGGGWVVSPADMEGFLDALEQARVPQERMARGRAARCFAAAHFDKAANVARAAGILSVQVC